MNIKIILKATDYNNRWPKIRIYNNDLLVDDVLCNNINTELTYDIEPLQDNKLILEFYGKSFGDGGIWDVGNNGEMRLELLDLKFDDVSIDHLIHLLEYETNWTTNQLTYEPPESIINYSKYRNNGLMTFNGRLMFEYSLPIYNFLINKKYKTEYDSNLAYFSNYTETFHYEKGLEKIAEIRKLIAKHG